MTVTVNGQNINTSDEELIVSESVDIYECEFEFDSSWDGWDKTARFEGSGVAKEMIIINDKTSIPDEVIKEDGWMRVGVYGTRNAQVMPTIWGADVYVRHGTEHESTKTTPTPSIYAQILNLANGAKDTADDAKATADNVSDDWTAVTATATTLEAGSPATATFSNNSFALGIPKGDTGATGAKGDKGDKGDTGATGAKGDKGDKGDNGDVTNIADAYSSSATYAVGDYCIYNSQLYRCTTAITTAEAWTAAHWTAVQLGDDVSDLRSALSFTDSYIIDEEPAELPNEVKGNYKIDINAEGDMVISGTHNVAQLLGIKEGTFTINGVTFVVSGTTITISGTATSAFNYSLVDGEAKGVTALSQMILPLPEHLYTLSTKALSGSSTPYPGLFVRSKASGNVVVSQNNTAQFTADKTTCGGLYFSITNGYTYNVTYKIAVLPYAATNGNAHREEDSDIDVYEQSGTYALDGYTWAVGSPTVAELRSKLPKKPLCKYSTRTIAYSSMTECLDVYVPSKEGYVNYVFGRTQNGASVVGGGDVWRLVQVDAVSDALALKFHITQLGETEMAIGIKDRDDFIGGSTHGDEVMDANSLVFVLDGQTVDVTTLTNLTEFDTLQVFLNSNMYDPADHTTLVGVHGREWLFNADGLYIGQTVEFKADLILTNSYMPMLCVLRGNDTASTLQVTDTYIDDGNYIPYDVSVGGFTTYPNQLKTDVREINLFGADSGVRATVKILEQPEGLNKEGVFLYNGANTYNKIYCCLCGYGSGTNTQNVANGEKWKVKSQITIEVG